MRILYVAFKGNGNSSNRIVSNLIGDKLFLTNSYAGLKKDIDSINDTYDLVYMFGLDKTLKGDIRIDSVAEKDDVRLCSDIDLDTIIKNLDKNGISAKIGYVPTKYLCNEAFWYMLKKYNHHVVFFHVPSIRYIDEAFIESLKRTLQHGEL
ncbi:MAG: hypothetical protein J1E83_00585 [Lachnospiraceae bacterium]|nr:hypothetical protein [Lachnospiraceae bacterium]